MEALHVLPLTRLLSLTIVLSVIFAGPVLSQAQYPRLSRQPYLSPNQPAGQPDSRMARQPAAQPYRAESEHFVVTADDPRLANRVASEAERFRKELAIEWLGTELGPWQDKCPIAVEIGMHAGGETSFAFVTDGAGQGRPISWQMKIFGPPDRILDAVLPHEITHTIFATHFGRPLPRWADEGACTTVEHESERNKNHRMLMDFLSAQPSRGIPFNRMFTMKNYPHDILPLYAQGYSLAKFLIAQKGRRYFLDYVAEGMNVESPGNELRAWDTTTEKYYGFDDLSDLQIAWLDWVRRGSSSAPEQRIAAVVEAPAPAARMEIPKNDSNLNPVVPASFSSSAEPVTTARGDSDGGSWYARQMKSGTGRVATNRESLIPEQAGSTMVRTKPEIQSPTIWR